MRCFASLMLLPLAFASTPPDYPLTLHVLGQSEQTREIRRTLHDPCVNAGMGAPCGGYDDMPGPRWAIDVVQVTGRLTLRGRTTEYELVCRTKAPKRACAAMNNGDYPARWNGKWLEVLVPDGRSKKTVNRFEVKGAHDASVD